ncbi:PPK2 family polyphosphate kinase [uncultured Nocardioides sp.]|uniref:PPK2 family polyphosphate kinase n=1 Tax=uncultured Nocardioides sp. TaxID=198441 RepID=UPI0026175672|nr:PPK2 family polyphosphate kinase [uncultured Nocardioides sp.]
MLELLRLPPGAVDLSSYDTRATPGFEGDKAAGREALAALAPDLGDLQERLFAERVTGSTRSVLLVLQGMDTAGKGGTVRHVAGLVDPQGLRITGFGAPTDEELAHDFLWRIRRALPAAGQVGVFDRSHYEDVLAAKVRSLADDTEIERRYGAINDFEAEVVESGTRVVKCLLLISPEEQKERLLSRMDDPTKQWKLATSDIDDRARWSDYVAAYETALERTSTEVAPWFVVPADRKWYRNLAVAHLLRDTLAEMAPVWPPAQVDVEGERRRLLEQDPIS